MAENNGVSSLSIKISASMADVISCKGAEFGPTLAHTTGPNKPTKSNILQIAENIIFLNANHRIYEPVFEISEHKFEKKIC